MNRWRRERQERDGVNKEREDTKDELMEIQRSSLTRRLASQERSDETNEFAYMSKMKRNGQC